MADPVNADKAPPSVKDVLDEALRDLYYNGEIVSNWATNSVVAALRAAVPGVGPLVILDDEGGSMVRQADGGKLRAHAAFLRWLAKLPVSRSGVTADILREIADDLDAIPGGES